jgi:hypothetical protein
MLFTEKTFSLFQYQDLLRCHYYRMIGSTRISYATKPVADVDAFNAGHVHVNDTLVSSTECGRARNEPRRTVIKRVALLA